MQAGGSVTYGCNHTCKDLCQLGSELSSGSESQFGGIMHANNNHWIAFSVFPKESVIYLADSLHWETGGADLPVAAKEVANILQWWLNESYSGLNKSTPTFQITSLPVAHQNDSSSCGFFALNALMHHLIPTKYLLYASNDIAMLRVEFLMAILNHHVEQIPPVPAVTSVAEMPMASMIEPRVTSVHMTTTIMEVMAAPAETVPFTVAEHSTKPAPTPMTSRMCSSVAQLTSPAALPSSPAPTGTLPNSDVKKPKEKKKKLDFTIQEGEEGYLKGLVRDLKNRGWKRNWKQGRKLNGSEQMHENDNSIAEHCWQKEMVMRKKR
ncbi:uncharacterized protein EI90DRAFT_3168485 [Cantharellus anzutake]|uniref:uncharacterized protein n=1 Tax=Cantharellus anzutake TaxID=1750568 RepID=UPI001907D700|nr:uncharacterized protein EI90DRAFT_3168485 [Cantharellus anzutake]KAF8336306.1 hypothetical protein EI90DRAFT_3168485 [Cantharellus anzutake]